VIAKTIEGQVENGQLHPNESLDAFEGQQVLVTVKAPAGLPPEPGDREVPEGIDLERDVYVRMPLQLTILEDVEVIDRGPMQPCIILPEELPDD
jgi:hypothetical protein